MKWYFICCVITCLILYPKAKVTKGSNIAAFTISAFFSLYWPLWLVIFLLIYFTKVLDKFIGRHING